MMIVAFLIVLLATALVVAPLFSPSANRSLGRGVESNAPVERWQREKNRLTSQLRDNDIALAEGRIDVASHDRNNRHLAGEAETTLTALRRARDAFGMVETSETHAPARITSILAALLVIGGTFGVSAVASIKDVDFTTSPHADGRVPIESATAPMPPFAGMPMNAEGAPDIEAMVARLETRVWDGDASPDDYRMLLRSYGVLGREADAPDVLKAAADQYPDDLEFRMNYLRMVVEAEDAPPAIELLGQVDTVLAAVPDMAEAHWYRSLLYLRLGQKDAARTDLEWLVVRLSPDHPATEKVRSLLAEVSGGRQNQAEEKQ